jgi:hypothetical protein
VSCSLVETDGSFRGALPVYTRLHGATNQKTLTFIFVTLRIWTLTYPILSYPSWRRCGRAHNLQMRSVWLAHTYCFGLRVFYTQTHCCTLDNNTSLACILLIIHNIEINFQQNWSYKWDMILWRLLSDETIYFDFKARQMLQWIHKNQYLILWNIQFGNLNRLTKFEYNPFSGFTHAYCRRICGLLLAVNAIVRTRHLATPGLEVKRAEM